MTNWQPIDTAPKDGTKILGYANGDMSAVEYHKSSYGEFWSLVLTGTFAEDGEWTPTHWMPLPEPPEVSNG